MKLLYTNGDSFTYGSELESQTRAWPVLLAKKMGYELVNDAQPGASNDYIVRRTVEFCSQQKPDLVIIGWTTPDRIEIGSQHCTHRTRPDIFNNWDTAWAKSKYNTQIQLLNEYLKMPHYFCTAWDAPINASCYIGRFVEWAYGTPHGPGGHPLEQGHKQIAEKIYEACNTTR